MEQFTEGESTREEIKNKLRQNFDGKIERTGLGSDSKCKEAVNTAFNYLKANGNRISGTMIKVDELANTLQVCLDSAAKKGWRNCKFVC